MNDAALSGVSTVQVLSDVFVRDKSDPKWDLDNNPPGRRTSSYTLDFSKKFRNRPHVMAAISSASVPEDRPWYLSVSVRNVTESNFVLEFQTWGEGLVSGATASWIAIGE